MISYQKQNYTIKIFFNKPYFFVGEFIKGNIEITLSSTALISGIIINIFSEENWSVKEGSDSNSKIIGMNSKKTIVSYNMDLQNLNILQKVDDDFLLPRGISIIPFNFRFSENNNPSFEYPVKNKRSYLRYTFNVILNSPYIFNNNNSFYICLISRPIIQTEKILTKSITKNIKKWKMFGKGNTILKVSIPENNFKYDSICKITIDIDNTNGKVSTKQYKAMLTRRIKYSDKLGQIKYIYSNEIVSEYVGAVVEPGKKQTFEYNMSLKEKKTEKKYDYLLQINPYNITMDKINFYMPSIKAEIISCDYEIKISLYFSCFVAYADRPRIILPIFIVHQLPIDYQLEIQEQIEYENALQKSIIDINNSKNNLLNDINNKIENNSLGKKSLEYYDDEDNSLPSLEAIEGAHNNPRKNSKNSRSSKKSKNSNKGGNLININDINYEDNCPPPLVYESAPVPLILQNQPIKIDNNNSYPIYNSSDFNNENNIKINNINDNFYNNENNKKINNINHNFNNNEYYIKNSNINDNFNNIDNNIKINNINDNFNNIENNININNINDNINNKESNIENNIKINNIYDNINNIENNNKINGVNDNFNNNINNEYNNINRISSDDQMNQINIIQESPDDFSLFDNDNNS